MAERTRNHGELEDEVMQILWRAEHPIDGRQVQAGFHGQVPAYTTVLTILDRLEKKGLVKRAGKSARKLLFVASHCQDEQISQIMSEALDTVQDREATLLRFAGNLSEHDLALLRKAIAPADPDQ